MLNMAWLCLLPPDRGAKEEEEEESEDEDVLVLETDPIETPLLLATAAVPCAMFHKLMHSDSRQAVQN